MVESKIAAYERSINSRTINNQPNNQAPVIQPTLYLRPEELHRKKDADNRSLLAHEDYINPRLPQVPAKTFLINFAKHFAT